MPMGNILSIFSLTQVSYEELRPYPKSTTTEVSYLPDTPDKETTAISDARSTASDKLRSRDMLSEGTPHPPYVLSRFEIGVQLWSRGQEV